MRIFAIAAIALCCSACSTVLPTDPKVEVVQPTSVRPAPLPVAEVSNGSIYQSAQYRPLFEDHRARMVGDIVTVQIVEKVSATASSTSSVEKNGSVTGGVSAFPFLKSNLLGKLSVTGSSANKFDGKGGTQNTNDFSGTITATVIEVLPNGHLVVAGEKQIGVNHNADVLRFSGQVDPRSIQPGNQVASAQIANVRVEQRGRGQVGDAQQIGWLARFFLSLSPI